MVSFWPREADGLCACGARAPWKFFDAPRLRTTVLGDLIHETCVCIYLMRKTYIEA